MDTASSDSTPKKLFFSEVNTKKTPISTPKSFASRFLLLSNNQSSTPSPSLKRHLIVRNPFESSQLHEKLHLPVISSPSLFNAPSTPQNSRDGSSKLEVFEWTIDELSNLNPVNVVPHETQFRLDEETDPDQEAQVQAAISSFFKEQQVVPSPLTTAAAPSCLRKKFELSYNFSQSKAANVTAAAAAIFSANQFKTRTEIRDMTTQTALSFPPNLPPEIEDLLKRYQHNDECNTNNGDCEEGGNNEMMDISTLRRKLFMHPETPERASLTNENFALDHTLNLSPAPRTPEFARQRHIFHSDKLATAVAPTVLAVAAAAAEDGIAVQRINSNLFGELSPIGKFDSSSDSSPIISSSTHDISMTSDFGLQEQTPTGSRQRCNKLKKKRLSDSFSMLHNEDSLSDKENDFEFHPVMSSKEMEGGSGGGSNRAFRRYDSGFREDSNQLNFSTEYMQI